MVVELLALAVALTAWKVVPKILGRSPADDGLGGLRRCDVSRGNLRPARGLESGGTMNDALDSLLERLTKGEMDAAGEVYRTFEPVLRVMVRRRLTPRLRAKFDSMDVVQSAWADVLKGFRDEGWRFSDREHLRAYLARVTYNHFVNYCRRHSLAVRARAAVRRRRAARSAPVGPAPPQRAGAGRRALGAAGGPLSPGPSRPARSSNARASRSPRSPPGPGCTRAACAASSTTWRGDWPPSGAKCPSASPS